MEQALAYRRIMDAKPALAQRIRAVRTVRHGNRGQSDFARELSVKIRTYWSYEKGEYRPPQDVLQRIADLTACGLVWLLTGFGTMGEPDDPLAVAALAEAIEGYGPEADMDIIKDQTLANVIAKYRALEKLLAESRSREERLALQVQQLGEQVKRLEKGNHPT